MWFFTEKEFQGKVGKKAYLENWITKMVPVNPKETTFKVTFDWDEEMGIPGAFFIRNNHFTKFFLKSLTLEDVPLVGRIHFDCNSWIYPSIKYNKDRIFFVNKVISYQYLDLNLILVSKLVPISCCMYKYI